MGIKPATGHAPVRHTGGKTSWTKANVGDVLNMFATLAHLIVEVEPTAASWTNNLNDHPPATQFYGVFNNSTYQNITSQPRIGGGQEENHWSARFLEIIRESDCFYAEATIPKAIQQLKELQFGSKGSSPQSSGSGGKPPVARTGPPIDWEHTLKTFERMVQQSPSNWPTSTGNKTKTFLVGDSTAQTYSAGKRGGKSPCGQMRQSICWDLADYVASGNCFADMMRAANDPKLDDKAVVIVVFVFNDLVTEAGVIVEPPDFPQQFRALCDLVKRAQRVVMIVGGSSEVYGFGPEWDDLVAAYGDLARSLNVPFLTGECVLGRLPKLEGNQWHIASNAGESGRVLGKYIISAVQAVFAALPSRYFLEHMQLIYKKIMDAIEAVGGLPVSAGYRPAAAGVRWATSDELERSD